MRDDGVFFQRIFVEAEALLWLSDGAWYANELARNMLHPQQYEAALLFSL